MGRNLHHILPLLFFHLSVGDNNEKVISLKIKEYKKANLIMTQISYVSKTMITSFIEHLSP
jgi:hypothetical protein